MQVLAAMARAIRIQPHADAIQERVLDIHNTMQDVFVDAGKIHFFITHINSLITRQAETAAMNVRRDISTQANYTLTDLSNSSYQETIIRLFTAQKNINTLIKWIIMQQNLTNAIWVKYGGLDLTDVLIQLSSTMKMLRYYESQCEIISNLSIQFRRDVTMITYSLSTANNSLVMSDMAVARAQNMLYLAGGYVQSLAQEIGTFQGGDVSFGEEMSGSGGSVSGSGIDTDEPVLPSSRSSDNVTSVGDGIFSLRLNINQLTRRFLFHDDEVCDAGNNTLLVQSSQELNK